MDPTNPNFSLSNQERELAPLRALMRHYAPFFIQQGSWIEAWGRKLIDLASSDDSTFLRFLNGEDKRLNYDERAVIGQKPWRTSFHYDGETYCGTAFEGKRWPIEIAGASPGTGTDRNGMFYWGIWKPIIEALRDGKLRDLSQMQVTPGETRYKGKLFILLSDGVGLAWAPNESRLNPRLFDDLPDKSPATGKAIRP